MYVLIIFIQISGRKDNKKSDFYLQSVISRLYVIRKFLHQFFVEGELMGKMCQPGMSCTNFPGYCDCLFEREM